MFSCMFCNLIQQIFFQKSVDPISNSLNGNTEYVNGGYGVKNPLLQDYLPPDVDPTPAPTSRPGAFSCRVCGKVK